MSRLVAGCVPHRTWVLLVVGMLSLQLSGCAIFREPVGSPNPQPMIPPAYPAAPASAEPAPSPAPPPSAPVPPVATRQFHLGTASTALVAQAHRQVAANDAQLAIGSIERALRIEPDNPLLWIELGEIHETAGHYDQAAGMGHKALQLATGDPRAQSASWHLIADSLKARGRNGEAAEAQRRADELVPQ